MVPKEKNFQMLIFWGGGVMSSKEMGKFHPIHPKVISNTELTVNACSFSLLNMNTQSHTFIDMRGYKTRTRCYDKGIII